MTIETLPTDELLFKYATCWAGEVLLLEPNKLPQAVVITHRGPHNAEYWCCLNDLQCL